jgi:hypothetical protein
MEKQREVQALFLLLTTRKPRKRPFSSKPFDPPPDKIDNSNRINRKAFFSFGVL